VILANLLAELPVGIYQAVHEEVGWSRTGVGMRYSKAQRPDPHSGRPQPKFDVPGLSHTGNELA
jgi:hypothetical protein